MNRPPRQLKVWRTPLLIVEDSRLFQEQLLDFNDDPDALAWYMACCCTIITKSNRKSAFPVMNRFLASFTPLSCACAPQADFIYNDIVEVLRPSGMYNIKATRIISLSADWVDHRPYDALAGASLYFRQSYELFVRKVMPRSEITDTHLEAYACAHASELLS